MIAALHGTVSVLSGENAIIDVNGVGYEVAATPRLLSSLAQGQEVRLITETLVAEQPGVEPRAGACKCESGEQKEGRGRHKRKGNSDDRCADTGHSERHPKPAHRRGRAAHLALSHHGTRSKTAESRSATG